MIGGFIGHPIGGAIGDAGRSASLSITLDNATLSSSSTLDLKAAVSVTLADATLSATSTVDLTGALTSTLGDASLSATGALLIQGTETSTLDDATLSATANLIAQGYLDATLDDATLEAFGEPTPFYAGIGHYLEELAKKRQVEAITKRRPVPVVQRIPELRPFVVPQPPAEPHEFSILANHAALAAQYEAQAQQMAAAEQQRQRNRRALAVLLLAA